MIPARMLARTHTAERQTERNRDRAQQQRAEVRREEMDAADIRGNKLEHGSLTHIDVRESKQPRME